VPIRFRGLDASEIEQLTDNAREFARQATRTRRLLPIYVRLYRAANDLRSAVIILPGPWFIAGPLQYVLQALVRTIFSAICDSLEHKIAAARPLALAVWLRRFHQAGEDRFPIHELFEDLSAWGILACTLSDDVVYKSTLAERAIRKWVNLRVLQLPEIAWWLKLTGLFFSFLFVIFLAGTALVLIATRQFSAIQQCLAVFVYFALVIGLFKVALRVIVRLIYRSKKFQEIYKPMFASEMAKAFSLSAAKAPDYFSNIVGNLNHQRIALDQGFLALVVADADWQAVVEAAIARANVILFDVTELSSNLQWELEHLARNVKLERVVLAFGFSEKDLSLDQNWQQHPSCRLLDEQLGPGWRSACKKFSYPQHIDTRDKRMLAKYMHRLVMEVYDATVLSES
jgi:hypothetical protein